MLATLYTFGEVVSFIGGGTMLLRTCEYELINASCSPEDIDITAVLISAAPAPASAPRNSRVHADYQS
jgi:hypothetical protein